MDSLRWCSVSIRAAEVVLFFSSPKCCTAKGKAQKRCAVASKMPPPDCVLTVTQTTHHSISLAATSIPCTETLFRSVFQGRCTRENCKYLHPPPHLKTQLEINGRNNLIQQKTAAAMFAQQMQFMLPGTQLQPIVSHCSELGFALILISFLFTSGAVALLSSDK